MSQTVIKTLGNVENCQISGVTRLFKIKDFIDPETGYKVKAAVIDLCDVKISPVEATQSET